MLFEKRKLSIFILVCFLWTCFFFVPSFGETSSNSADAAKSELQNDTAAPADADDEASSHATSSGPTPYSRCATAPHARRRRTRGLWR
jgi:hypothetical protein